jgi:hypothetical protein
MSSKKIVFALILACGLSAQAQMEAKPKPKLTSVYLVKITDMVKEDSYEVMSREEVAALQKAINEEARVFPMAMAAVKKAWAEDELTKEMTFPAGAFSVRKMLPQGPFSSEQADKKMEQMQDREYAAQERKRDQDKKHGSKDPKAQAKELEKEAKRETALRTAQDQLMAKMAEMLKREIPKPGL